MRHDHLRYTERASQPCRVQRTGAAEGHHRVAPRVPTALQRHDAHGALHIAVGDSVDTPGRLAQRQLQRIAHIAHDARFGAGPVEPHRAAVEIIRVEIAQHQIGVGHGGRRPAIAVTNRPRVGAGAFRPDLDDAHLGARDTAAAGADLQQLHRRQADRQAAARLVVDRIDLEARHDRGHAIVDRPQLGRGAAHVEGQHLIGPLLRRHVAAHQHTGGRPGLDDADRIFAREVRRDETAIRLHDEEVVAEALRPERALQVAEITGHSWLDVAVGDRCAGPLIFAELRRHVGGQRDQHVRRACRDTVAHRPLMRRVGVGMQQRYGDRLVAAFDDSIDDGGQRGIVQRRQHRTIEGHPLIELENVAPADQRRGLVHVEIVGLVALLTADQYDVAEAARGDQCRLRAFALDDRVGRNGRPVQHAFDRIRGEARLFQEPLEPGQNRFCGIRLRGRNLQRARSVRSLQDEIGKGSPNVKCRAHLRSPTQ